MDLTGKIQVLLFIPLITLSDLKIFKYAILKHFAAIYYFIVCNFLVPKAFMFLSDSNHCHQRK